MDASLWPQYCKDTLKIVPSTWTAQLPATVLYMRGKEAGRLPRPEECDDIGLKRNKYKKVGGLQGGLVFRGGGAGHQLFLPLGPTIVDMYAHNKSGIACQDGCLDSTLSSNGAVHDGEGSMAASNT
jgi:hypothetical protein